MYISQESHWQKQVVKLDMALHSLSGSGALSIGTSLTNVIIPFYVNLYVISEEARRVGGEVAASPARTKEMIFIR